MLHAAPCTFASPMLLTTHPISLHEFHVSEYSFLPGPVRETESTTTATKIIASQGPAPTPQPGKVLYFRKGCSLQRLGSKPHCRSSGEDDS